MKFFYVVAALFGIWLSIDAASVISPDPEVWDKSSMMQFQNECIAKVKDDEDFLLKSVDLKYTFMNVFLRIVQKMRYQNSLDSLDTIINETCPPMLNEEKLYDLLMKIVQVCLNQQDPFTEEEKQIVKNKLEQIFCNLYMKLAAIISFSPECLVDSNAMMKISSCSSANRFSMTESVRTWFFPSPDVCKKQSKSMECVNNVISGECSSEISDRIKSTLSEAAVILGCASSEPEHTSVSTNAL